MMNTPRRLGWFGLMVIGLLVAGNPWDVSQGAAAPEKAKPDATGSPAAKPDVPAAAPKAAIGPAALPARAAGSTASQGPFRPLSPGAMKTVDSMREVDEAVSRHDVVELLASDPNLDWAKDIPFRREIWALQFRFKPMRVIHVDLPQPSGFMQRKPIWYMVYSITNPGKTMRPVANGDGTYKTELVDKPVRFVPGFLLHSVDCDKWYPERLIPAAIGPIRMREDPNRTFLNMEQISRDDTEKTGAKKAKEVPIGRELRVGETVWGIATWEDIDPRTERFSVYVTGLTNAYRWTDDPGKYKPGLPLGTGRHLVRKTLKLNFWRPGDEFNLKEREIRYGAPGELDYQWVYR